MTLATNLVDQLRVMCLSIPFSGKGHQAISEVIKVGEVEDAQPLPLQNTEPLLTPFLSTSNAQARRRRQSAGETGAMSRPACLSARSNYPRTRQMRRIETGIS